MDTKHLNWSQMVLCFRCLGHPHQWMQKFCIFTHLKPTFSIFHSHFYKTPTSVCLLYTFIQIKYCKTFVSWVSYAKPINTSDQPTHQNIQPTHQNPSHHQPNQYPRINTHQNPPSTWSIPSYCRFCQTHTSCPWELCHSVVSGSNMLWFACWDHIGGEWDRWPKVRSVRSLARGEIGEIGGLRWDRWTNRWTEGEMKQERGESENFLFEREVRWEERETNTKIIDTRVTVIV